ncbi:hypothetical protein K435DRAFT_493098 [Dendrothele bispora CBS 962.96]|uniref:Uncharacterized protein n=1 Tax=Dendrothele bispora (strain CBS 962.96) TaxID=1314807 RepID=A0A4S8MAR2_DENBC|nr:hypothetical protein K435DRAFT_493098 [Dendrothele bispora CBS 962.96]
MLCGSVASQTLSSGSPSFCVHCWIIIAPGVSSFPCYFPHHLISLISPLFPSPFSCVSFPAFPPIAYSARIYH